METLYCILASLLLLGSFYYQQSKLIFPALGLLIWLSLDLAGINETVSWTLALVIGITGMILQNNTSLRRSLITDRLFEIAKNVLPRMSDTEKEALEAGTVWFDREIFSGSPNWQDLYAKHFFKLTAEEQKFIDGPVETLCEMLDDWQINQERDLPPDVWEYLKKEKFFGLIIPKEHGGLGFSASGHSAVVTKISTRSIAAAVTVMVPNSLGPGELLLHYGTEEQKKKYLKKLAEGIEIPCFALTGPEAGSDAGAMQSFGTVVKKKVKGKDVIGISLDFNKRYITLAPIATLIGLAFKLRDPDQLLGAQVERGITCALIPRNIKGLEIGNRHDPMGVPFANGPLKGKDVFIPISSIIGGEVGIGRGWKMLVESLAAGRSISLPSMSVGAAQLSTRVCGAYATIREQFDTPIGRFEGVEELLARIAGYTYMMDAARNLTCAAIDQGEKPSVLSGAVKAYLTEGMRQTLNDAMDLRAGAAIIRGPQNILSRAYAAIPIGITVEGSNVLTRSMIIYGQGAIRSHPYLLKEMVALQEGNKDEFDKYFWKHIFSVFKNSVRCLVLGFSLRTGLIKLTNNNAQKLSQAKLDYLCAGFALVSDMALAFYGGSLKRREMISGRFADTFSWIYLGASALKRYDTDKETGMEDIMLWSINTACHKAYNALLENIDNFGNLFLRIMVKSIVAPFALRMKAPNDALTGAVAAGILDGDVRRELLSENVYVPQKDDPALGRLEHALNTLGEVLPIKKKLRQARRDDIISSRYGEKMIMEGIEANIITVKEAEELRKYNQLLNDVVDVDDFKPKDYKLLR